MTIGAAPPPDRRASTGIHQAKRLKIDVACNTCRLRKVKCDGVRPACGNCTRRYGQRDKCQYSIGEHSNETENQANAHLPAGSGSNYHSQIQPCLLNGVDASSGTAHPPQSQIQTLQPSIQALFSSPSAVPSITTLASGHLRSNAQSLGPQEDTIPSIVDSMTAVVDDGVATGEYFGSSSAGSFIAQVKDAIGALLGQSKDNTSQSVRAQGPVTLTSPFVRLGLSLADYVLPPRKQADHLLGIYWFYVDPLYPFLSRPKWELCYDGLFAGTSMDVDERVFVATLNIIFALSTQLDESLTPGKRDESSSTYFRRAQDMLPVSFLESGSVELVQYMLLSSQYLQSTNHPHQTWMVVGSAVRIAQSLGLHLPEVSSELVQLNQRELLRRIWHGCILMDRMVSLTHGRPAMVSDKVASAVPLPLARAGAPHDGDQLTEASFFVKSVELYHISHRIVQEFYSSPISYCRVTSSAERIDEDLGIVMRLDRLLSNWQDELPENLITSHLESANNKVSHRQAIILQLRFLHTRMLLLRPMLARVCLIQSPSTSPGPIGTLQGRVMQQCALFCVESAQSIIGMLIEHQVCDGTVGLLPAWWYRVFYLFSAATVIIAARLRPDIFLPAAMSRTWNQAMQVLQAHESLGVSAKRCMVALQILASKILPCGQTTGTDSNSRSTQDGEYIGPHSDPVTPPQLVREFTEYIPENLELAGITFNVDDLSWLNESSAWMLLNGS